MSFERAQKLQELGEFLLSAGHTLDDDGTEPDLKELSRLLAKAFDKKTLTTLLKEAK